HADLFDVTPTVERPSRKIRTSGFFGDFAELKPGDYVVHVDHGIGQFEGLRQIESGGHSGEFMLLKYAEDARLYVPLERMDLVQTYRVLEGTHPPLDKLGGTVWNARKTRARKSVEDMADQLLALYAQRKTTEGFAFSPDGNFQREFEDAFEFEETADQVTAIRDIKRDMERPEPMDRLLSKDVKFADLGLLIVDEEQRFGVAHKERLKEMRKNVDALALSATPIPRTLHMSLVGLRDMSVIETPPRDRLAIQTVVAPFR